jgi:hypothetical protein
MAGRTAWEQVAYGSPQHEERAQEEERQHNPAEQDHHQKAWPFAPMTRIRRYAMDKWFNHMSLDARI